LSVAFIPATSYAAKGVVKIWEADWTGNLVFGQLVQIILEEEMDYKVKQIFMAGTAGWEAMASGDLDIALEAWPSYNADAKARYFADYGGDGSVMYVTESGVVGASDYYVPRYVCEGDSARGIKATAPDLCMHAKGQCSHCGLEKLKPYADVFASPETKPKGRLIGCPVAGWGCEDQARLDAAGLDFTAVELGTDTAQWAELTAAIKRGEPILVYAWEPMWIFAAFDLVGIGIPKNEDGSCWPTCGWPEDVTFQSANPDFANKHPDVIQMIKNMKLSNAQQAPMIFDVDVNKMPVEDAVRKWMASNEDTWRPWLP
jgi:glycine betaine/proline transport system substrate-binding protein